MAYDVKPIAYISSDEHLAHHGIKGQKWGVRRFEDAEGHLTAEGKLRYSRSRPHNPKKGSCFISGTGKFTGELPPQVKSYLDEAMANGNKILVGDFMGVDAIVQDYCAKAGYKNVAVYYSGKAPRAFNNAGLSWKKVAVPTPKGMDPDSPEYHALKDIAMTNDATYGFGIWNGESRATGRNFDRLEGQGKPVHVYNYVEEGWVESDKRKHIDPL